MTQVCAGGEAQAVWHPGAVWHSRCGHYPGGGGTQVCSGAPRCGGGTPGEHPGSENAGSESGSSEHPGTQVCGGSRQVAPGGVEPGGGTLRCEHQCGGTQVRWRSSVVASQVVREHSSGGVARRCVSTPVQAPRRGEPGGSGDAGEHSGVQTTWRGPGAVWHSGA
ncbi:hypothetical protein GPJ56_004097 [Histomonas meleagridis]|nr:hypothetical protein GPJ56_004097 [Histomonas meleagridis]